MENVYLSVVNYDSVLAVLGITILICLSVGVTDFVENLKKMGE